MKFSDYIKSLINSFLFSEKTGIKGTVTAILRDFNGNIKQVQTTNLITDDGVTR